MRESSAPRDTPMSLVVPVVLSVVCVAVVVGLAGYLIDRSVP